MEEEIKKNEEYLNEPCVIHEALINQTDCFIEDFLRHYRENPQKDVLLSSILPRLYEICTTAYDNHFDFSHFVDYFLISVKSQAIRKADIFSDFMGLIKFYRNVRPNFSYFDTFGEMEEYCKTHDLQYRDFIILYIKTEGLKLFRG